MPNPHVHQQTAASHIEMEKRDRRFIEHNDVSRGIEEPSSPDKAGHSNGNQGNRISRCHIRFLRNDKDVELIREDGSKELHSLIK